MKDIYGYDMNTNAGTIDTNTCKRTWDGSTFIKKENDMFDEKERRNEIQNLIIDCTDETLICKKDFFDTIISQEKQMIEQAKKELAEARLEIDKLKEQLNNYKDTLDKIKTGNF